MPEGDTLYRTAERLRPALAGEPVTELRVHRTLPTRIPTGVSVAEVRAVGKHLLIGFDDGHLLDSHLLMNGSWDLYRQGERWRGSPGSVRAVVATEAFSAVLRSTPRVRLYAPGDRSPKPWEQLGPDLCVDDLDPAVLVERARRLPPDTDLSTVLLDQRVAAGIGNVYKSETLWAERLSPFATLGSVSDEDLGRAYLTAARLLRANLDRSRRVTHGRGLAVYGRDRSSCPRCAGRIRVAAQGELDRATWWCPRCQPAR